MSPPTRTNNESLMVELQRLSTFDSPVNSGPQLAPSLRMDAWSAVSCIFGCGGSEASWTCTILLGTDGSGRQRGINTDYLVHGNICDRDIVVYLLAGSRYCSFCGCITKPILSVATVKCACTYYFVTTCCSTENRMNDSMLPSCAFFAKRTIRLCNKYRKKPM
jgi:hypothetical protein